MKPMLATKVNLDKLRFPCYASPKLDGFRCLIINGEPLTRSLKPIANQYIRETLRKHSEQIEGFDGELIVGDPKSPNCFSVTSSAVTSYDGEPKFRFMVFDHISSDTWENRWLKNKMLSLNAHPSFIEFVQQTEIDNFEHLSILEEKFINQGYEGVMLRDPKGTYKFGRSTMNEQFLMKLKRFEDFEAEVIGFEEKMHNENDLEKDNLGHAKRSSKANGMVPAGVLGALVCRSPYYADSFNVGSGFDDATKKEIWDNKEKFLGKLAKVKHQPAGAKDKPRFPTFIGWRDESDL